MIRTRSLSLALVLALGASAAHADDLIQIYQEARSSDPTLAGAEATKLSTDEGVDQARSFLLPQLGASIDYTRSRSGNDADGTLKFEEPDGTIIPRPYTSTTTTSISEVQPWMLLPVSQA